MWPQYTFLVLIIISLTVNLVKHGDEHPDYNFWTAVVAIGLEFWILTAGGFFSKLF